MFRIKICGITNAADAHAAAAAGADAIGLNFYRKSKRFVSQETARQIAALLPTGVMKVGVFVNHAAAEIQHTLEHVRLDCLQLHGDESPTFLAALPDDVKIVRAFRCGREGLAMVSNYLDECRAVGRVPDAVLLDSDAATEFGGTGQLADWNSIADQRDKLGALPVVLAGGLTPENVAEGIRIVRPYGVDVASGVESAAGKKDDRKVRNFIAAARAAFS